MNCGQHDIDALLVTPGLELLAEELKVFFAGPAPSWAGWRNQDLMEFVPVVF